MAANQLKSMQTDHGDRRGEAQSIRDALLAAEAFSSPEEEIEITCHYNGAPEYRIELKAPDFKTAEALWEQATSATLTHVVEAGGEADAIRE